MWRAERCCALNNARSWQAGLLNGLRAGLISPGLNSDSGRISTAPIRQDVKTQDERRLTVPVSPPLGELEGERSWSA